MCLPTASHTTLQVSTEYKPVMADSNAQSLPISLAVRWTLLRVQVADAKRRSYASYPHQRSLHLILAYVPTTAGSPQFCMLCCQPEPIPG